MAKKAVKKNFSKYAKYYDKYSTIQNFCGVKLIDMAGEDSFDNILDIGCGTGSYTELLREKFPKAHIEALDISEEMIEVARVKLLDSGVRFTIKDGEDLQFNQKFDLISSNATFQWFGDLEKSLEVYRDALSKNGVVLFSIFGPRTLCELNKSIKKLFGEDASISSYSFISKSSLEKVLRSNFCTVQIEEETYEEAYSSLRELLNKIKYTGTGGSGVKRAGCWTPKKIDELEKVYKNMFKDITATYQVFFCKGIK